MHTCTSGLITSALPSEGCPSLRQVQNARYYAKNKGAAGVAVKDMLALKNLAMTKYLMPPISSALSLLPDSINTATRCVRHQVIPLVSGLANSQSVISQPVINQPVSC